MATVQSPSATLCCQEVGLGPDAVVNKELFPGLRERGVDEAGIEGTMVDAPKRISSIDLNRVQGAKDTLLREPKVDLFGRSDWTWPPAGS